MSLAPQIPVAHAHREARLAQGGEMELLARLSQEDLAAVRTGVPASVTPVGLAKSAER